MREVMQAIRARGRTRDVVHLILEASCELTGALHGSLSVVDHAKGELSIESWVGEGWTEDKRKVRIVLGQGVTGRVAATGQPCLVVDVALEPNYVALFDHLRSGMAAPVFLGETVWGVINLDGLKVGAFEQRDLATLVLFAEMASLALMQQSDEEEQGRLRDSLFQSEKMASLGKAVAGLVHEISNPLTSVLGHAQLLEQSVKEPLALRSVRTIVEEAERATRMIRDLLDFTRQEPLRPTLMELNELVRAVRDIVVNDPKSGRVQVVLDLDATPQPVLVNAERIQQVLLNLVMNGIEAIPAQRTAGRVIMRTRRGERTTVLEVEDNGEGMSEECAQHVFDPFFTTRPPGQGNGLGLAMAHSVVVAHGGRIYFETHLGKGTTFYVELPLACGAVPAVLTLEPVEEVAKAEDAPSEAVADAKKPVDAPKEEPVATSMSSAPSGGAATSGVMDRSILLVDDEPCILDSLQQFFKAQRVDVECAMDGNEALEMLRQRAYSVVVSDVRMPGMDGTELYEAALVCDPGYVRRFIFMSGDLSQGNLREQVAATRCFCLEKPFTFGALKKAVDAVKQYHLHVAQSGVEAGGVDSSAKSGG
jgi:signal transduction histidine kinase/ActR/RegA family two-component response regulator